MSKLFIAIGSAVIGVGVMLVAGCGGKGNAQVEFPPGAFPPTLSDMDYHRQDWTRTDCLVCHEKGLQGAPVMKHASVGGPTKEAKCRTCHVLIPDSKPRQ